MNVSYEVDDEAQGLCPVFHRLALVRKDLRKLVDGPNDVLFIRLILGGLAIASEIVVDVMPLAVLPRFEIVRPAGGAKKSEVLASPPTLRSSSTCARTRGFRECEAMAATIMWPVSIHAKELMGSKAAQQTAIEARKLRERDITHKLTPFV